MRPWFAYAKIRFSYYAALLYSVTFGIIRRSFVDLNLLSVAAHVVRNAEHLNKVIHSAY